MGQPRLLGCNRSRGTADPRRVPRRSGRDQPEVDRQGVSHQLNNSSQWLVRLRWVLSKRTDNWSATSLRQPLVQSRDRLIKHIRLCWLLLAESHLTRRLFGCIVRWIGRALALATGQSLAAGRPNSQDEMMLGGRVEKSVSETD